MLSRSLSKDSQPSIDFERQNSMGSPTATTSLKERRGLKLGIDTGGGAAAKAVQAATNSPPAVQKTPEKLSVSTEPKVLMPKEEATMDRSASQRSTYSSNNPVEPASPLLVRRMGSTPGSTKGPDVKLPVPVEVPQPQPQLRIEATKAANMDLEAPSSPKRVRRKSGILNAGDSEALARSAHSSPSLTGIHAGKEAQDSEAL